MPFLYIIGIIGTIFFVYYFVSVFIQSNSAEHKEYKRKLKESLSDEFIIDPETGTKITLEEAESGHWIAHDNEFRTMSESDLEKLFDKFRNDDDLQLKDYESFTFRKSYDLIKINKLLENFENQKGLEIEFNDENLFIKTSKLISLEDIKRIEETLKNVG